MDPAKYRTLIFRFSQCTLLIAKSLFPGSVSQAEFNSNVMIWICVLCYWNFSFWKHAYSSSFVILRTSVTLYFPWNFSSHLRCSQRPKLKASSLPQRCSMSWLQSPPLIVTLRLLVSRLLSPAGPAPQLGWLTCEMWLCSCPTRAWAQELLMKNKLPCDTAEEEVAWVSDWKSLFGKHGCPTSRSFPGYHRARTSVTQA